MTTIYKYPLKGSTTHLELPFGAQILTVQIQGDQLVLWAVINPREVRTVQRLIFAVYTGEEFDLPSQGYIGTAVSRNGIVWHVFEVLP